MHSSNVFNDERCTFVGKPNTTSPIWNNFHSCHPSAIVQVSSSSRDRKRSAGQVCIGEAFSKLAKYEQYSGKWKMLTRNEATNAVFPIPQRARAAEQLRQNSETCLNRMPCHRVCIQDIWTSFKYFINRMRQFTVRDLSYRAVSSVDRINDYNGFSPRRSC